MNITKPQRMIYNMIKVDGDAVATNCSSLLIDGNKDISDIQYAVNELFRHNDVLRLRIEEKNGDVNQYFCEYTLQEFEVLHFDSKAELDAYATAYSKEPIKLTNALCDFRIVILPGQFGILVKLHHIISDAWTFGLLFTQFNTLISKGQVTAYSYADYCESEKSYISGKRYEKDRAYFLDQINKCNSPVFISEKESLSLETKRKIFVINGDDARKIRNLVKALDCSVFSLFALSLAIYISRIKMNADKFYIGTTILNRNNNNELNTAGIFINTVPMLLEPDGNKSFREILEKTEDSLMSVFRHQKYNYTDLLTDLNKDKITHKKLFDVMINYMNAFVDVTDNQFQSTWYYNTKQSESLKINIDDRDNEGVFKMHYDYQTEKFSENDIDEMHCYIYALLCDAIENPDKKINDLEMLSTEEKQKILFDFNNTRCDYEKDKCIHELFEEQAERTPDKVALVATDKTLSYRELNEEANRIAHSLLENGVGKGDVVGLMLPRRSYLLSALFGILKTGAAYLPIDPDHPEERTEHMLSDSNAKYCITDENISKLLKGNNTKNPESTACSEDICYCIYTSGSTGMPKGTLLTHRNAVNYVSANKKNVFFGATGKDCKSILSVTTVGFDIFVTESLLPMVNGMKVILADEEQSILQSGLSELVRKVPADIMQTTPTKMKSFMTDKNNLDYLKSFKIIILGGEALDTALVKELKKKTDAEIYNIYGPTETTVWVSYAKIDDPDNITIGKPMANTQVYILDSQLRPVPIGVTGELCITGDSVSAGYLNRPEQTAEKFIDNPFGVGKLYRTGDNAYWCGDGNIVFVGRSDYQVKIRGLRIELGEIESTMQAIEGIERAIAVVRKDSQCRQLICAFYTGEEKSAKELRDEIGRTLPKYMLPHIFTHLEEIPLTASGKVNRNALPEIDLGNINTQTEYVAPQTEKEVLLTECICNVLHSGKVSILDNFFDIGGDSLKAIELTARLEERGYTVPVKTIFSCKDIQELAEKLEAKESEKVKIEYGSIIPATAAQMRVYTAQLLKPESMMYNITYAFKAEDVNKEKLESAVNLLIDRHESLRTRFENREGRIVQIIEEKSEISVENTDDINSFAKPFDLSKAPLVRVGCNNNTVIISLHHIIADGETMPVLFRELNELYMGRELDTTVQYGEFAVKDAYTEENENYWLETFSKEAPQLELPSDRPRTAEQSFNGSIYYEQIEKKLHEKIEEKCKEKVITPYVYYMACLSILLSKLTGNEDIVIGTPISGRQSRFLETVGMFVNTIALRSRPEGNKTVSELLGEIRDISIEAIDNQNYPFGELVKKLNTNSAGRNPLFDVMLAYQSFEMTDITFADKKVELIPLSATAAKCDITFNILPRKDDVVFAAEYCTDLYNEKRISGFVQMYKRLLEVCLDGGKQIREISVTDMKTLNSFNCTSHSYDIPANATLYSLFERTAEKNKDKICIKTAERNITFGNLLSLSEGLDKEIRGITDGKKSVIAVIAERSVEMYSAIYGIIRGGNAYLPIDTSYPQERIDYILKNSDAAAVVAQGKFVDLAGSTPCIDMTKLTDNKQNNDNIPAACADENDTAYVIYTSGSTGAPKGAKISHKSAINRILWMHDLYHLGADDVILQKTPYTFDVSVWEIFWWGICGGCLAVSKPGEHFLPAKINEDVYTNKVTHLHFVPSVFELFIKYLEDHKDELYKLESVKHLFLSGEALSANLVKRFYALFDSEKAALHNLYGPTECAVDVTYYDCKPSDIDPLPIGKPIYNTQIYILDKYNNPVPSGVTGELSIAGMNVGQGYINNPQLTAEKFIDNPFGEGKLYKTGDLAYRRKDGNIVFVGRKDGQIKLNGQRIEIGEIEAVIGNSDGVDSVTVAVREVNGTDTLVAFYTGKNGQEEKIRSLCSDKLPGYMVPGRIIHLDKMPFGANGKLDRTILSEYEISLSEQSENEPPINDKELLICEAFKEILDKEYIGRNCDFFQSGGTSLSMISLLSKKGFKEISASDFIRNSTPAKLAGLMSEKESAKPEYLEPLYLSPNSEKTLILLPFAGGGAEAYSNFVSSLRNENDRISAYFVPYLHSFDECKKAATEIISILGNEKIMIYSHCVGSAVALQIIKHIEENGVCVSYFAGASIPPEKPTKHNLWNKVPDVMLKGILSKAGAELDSLGEERLTELLRNFRKDTDFANISYSDSDYKIKSPTYVIISKNDIFTLNYKQAERSWSRYAEKVLSIRFIDSKNHYFQAENSRKLIEIIFTEQ